MSSVTGPVVLVSSLSCVFRHVHKIEKSNYRLCHVCPSAWNNSAPIGWISIKYDIWLFLKKSVMKIQDSLKSDMINRYITRRPKYIYPEA
jgi:hypothetical protein